MADSDEKTLPLPLIRIVKNDLPPVSGPRDSGQDAFLRALDERIAKAREPVLAPPASSATPPQPEPPPPPLKPLLGSRWAVVQRWAIVTLVVLGVGADAAHQWWPKASGPITFAHDLIVALLGGG